MNKYEREALVLRLLKRLKEEGSWAGHTHIQKSVYFLQELTEVPTGFNFILYKHGPYSFDLSDELNEMKAKNILSFEPKVFPYGPSYREGAAAQLIATQYSQKADEYRKEIDFVAGIIGNKGVSELERLATALFVIKESGGSQVNPEPCATRLTEIKPHIPYDKALSAVQTVIDLQEKVATEH